MAPVESLGRVSCTATAVAVEAGYATTLQALSKCFWFCKPSPERRNQSSVILFSVQQLIVVGAIAFRDIFANKTKILSFCLRQP